MDWKVWRGKKIFVQLKSGAVYSGDVFDVDTSEKDIVFLSLIDKYGSQVTFVTSEIIKIVEEK